MPWNNKPAKFINILRHCCVKREGQYPYIFGQLSPGQARNIVSATKVFPNYLENNFTSHDARFCSCNNVSRGGQTEKRNRKYNVSGTMFPSYPGL